MSHRMKMNQHIITMASPPRDEKLFKRHCSGAFLAPQQAGGITQSVTIARRAKRLNARPAMRELALLEPPYHLALAIFRDSIRAFADGDCEHARTLKLKDRELDALVDEVTETLAERLARE